jgi:O-antigen ligase
MLLRLGLVALILGLGLSNALMETGAIISCASLLAYYALDWRGSNLRRLKPAWPIFLMMGLILFKAVDTIAPSASLYALRHLSYKGPVLVLAGLEAVRSRRHLALMAWAFAAMAALRGLSGIREYLGSQNIAEKRVGNLMALALPMTFCLPLFLPRTWPAWRRWLIAGLVAAPGLFVWAATEARSGWIGLAVAALAFYWLRKGALKAALAVSLVLAAALLLRPANLTPEAVAHDARWEIWGVALQVWKAHPILGAGLEAFEAGYKALGVQFDPTRYNLPIPHPHNIYLQSLAETGLVGLAVFLLFTWGYALRAGLRIRAALAAAARDREAFAFWFSAGCFWCSFLGYLAAGISAHSFSRSWWLAAAMTILGLTLGACAHGPEETPPPA